MFLVFVSIVVMSCAESDELQILLKLKSALKNSNTDVFSSWIQGRSACNFNGVVCNSNGFIKEINLPHQQLVGYLPFGSICELKSLVKIDFGDNSLYGKVTDEDMKNCTGLQYPDLGLNSFSGQVPDLSPLNELKFLSLNSSGFSGHFPWKSLENLKELTFLSLGDNPFASSPFPQVVLYLEKLFGCISQIVVSLDRFLREFRTFLGYEILNLLIIHCPVRSLQGLSNLTSFGNFSFTTTHCQETCLLDSVISRV